jgi:hypothetical protein
MVPVRMIQVIALVLLIVLCIASYFVGQTRRDRAVRLVLTIGIATLAGVLFLSLLLGGFFTTPPDLNFVLASVFGVLAVFFIVQMMRHFDASDVSTAALQRVWERGRIYGAANPGAPTPATLPAGDINITAADRQFDPLGFTMELLTLVLAAFIGGVLYVGFISAEAKPLFEMAIGGKAAENNIPLGAIPGVDMTKLTWKGGAERKLTLPPLPPDYAWVVKYTENGDDKEKVPTGLSVQIPPGVDRVIYYAFRLKDRRATMPDSIESK